MLNDPQIQARVEELLARMSLGQKIGQMTQTERMAITPAEVKAFHIGSVLSGGGSTPGQNLPSDWVSMNDAYWAASMEQDENHLAIPLIYGVDAVHGNSNVKGATVFPHNIGLGAANDPDLIERVAKVTAREILATGVEWTFAPTLAAAQDYHWGRTYESYSENPALVASYADRFVIGLQGDLGNDSVVACVKHWVGDGGTTNGIDQGETTLAWDQLEATHVSPYYPALQAGVMTVMASFNSWNSDKCHGHQQLLTDVLKQKLNFNGFIISDWDGIDYLSERYYPAIAMGVNAGIDMFMVSANWRPFIDHLRSLVEEGVVSIDRIDDAVRRILRVKFAYGLFEKARPAQRPWSNHPSFGSAGHREVACEAVRKSLVLLKNDAQLLPLQKAARVLVAGKNAHNRGHQCGGFTIDWQGTSGNDKIIGGTSIWEGIRAMAPGSTLDIDGNSADPGQHDVAVVVIGETPYAEGMGDIRDGDDVIVQAGSQIKGLLKVLEPYGSSLELSKLHPEDLQTITTITARGIPVVAILVSGRPLLIKPELAAATAFVAAWLPGSEGQGVAQVLFGDHNFSGKLSFSWPEHQLTPGTAGGKGNSPLFPRGYGLLY